MQALTSAFVTIILSLYRYARSFVTLLNILLFIAKKQILLSLNDGFENSLFIGSTRRANWKLSTIAFSLSNQPPCAHIHDRVGMFSASQKRKPNSPTLKLCIYPHPESAREREFNLDPDNPHTHTHTYRKLHYQRASLNSPVGSSEIYPLAFLISLSVLSKSSCRCINLKRERDSLERFGNTAKYKSFSNNSPRSLENAMLRR